MKTYTVNVDKVGNKCWYLKNGKINREDESLWLYEPADSKHWYFKVVVVDGVKYKMVKI